MPKIIKQKSSTIALNDESVFEKLSRWFLTNLLRKNKRKKQQKVLNKMLIVDKIKDFSQEELAALIQHGTITIEDIYVAHVMDAMWKTDDTKWPRA